MQRQHTRSQSPLEDVIGFSRAIRSGQHVFVSGTAPLDNDGKTMFPNDVYNQTLRCFEISEKAINELDASLEDVVRTRIMLTDISQWKDAAKAHGKYFSSIKPACTFVQVSGFIDKDWLVETEVDCISID